ncbi:hypothetical protein M408DRAFT_332624 [Serendipita vermifera MAFF 305830]|uniref:Cytochrome P450 n=1 Tax=Serendipita vermifera MAFF 305830 TaxID=933852 RepID=A0A0C2W924_SERVB|nr:hypothetical protein M408DRAFT_332624 [Serendipita vermifera MAFF 305830]
MFSLDQLTLTPRNAAAFAAFLASIWAIKTYIRYRALMLAVGWNPGPKTFFSRATPITLLLPDIPGINRKADWTWKEKYWALQQYGQDIVANIIFYPRPRAIIQLADPKSIKDILFNRAAYPKPLSVYKPLELYGANAITTEGETWRIHHKVVVKSFSEQNNKLVWKETVNTMMELFSMWEMEGQGDEAHVSSISELTKSLTLMVIGSAAFGMKMTWKDDEVPPVGHTMTFRKTLQAINTGLVLRLALPNWILNLNSHGRKIRTSFDELGLYMREMIDTRLTSPHHHDDLFSNLLRAREEEKEGGTTFTDSDLTGNIFAFLFAGHETSAHTLAFALAHLAFYPEVQERFLSQIRENIPSGQLPTYADMPKLTYGTAIMQEVLRLIPIAPVIPKVSEHNTQFTTRASDGSTRNIPVPAGTYLMINTIGLHYNPTYWEDPYEFRPERFLQEYEKFAWLPFSAGPRACIGRRFAEIEILAVLTLFVMNYEITVTEDVKEDPKKRKARLLDPKRGPVVMYPKKIPLTFRRRASS